MDHASRELGLSPADVERLLCEPSDEIRAETATKLARALDPSRLSANEQAILHDILGIMAHDAETRVRTALAQALCLNPHVPRDLAMRLVCDVASVAVPFIEAAVVLDEADLLQILDFGSPDHHVAVARRPVVTERVAETLAERGGEQAVAALMANEGAALSERTLHVALDRFGTVAAVNEPMVRRKKLPVTVAERLVSLVADNLLDHLLTHHELPADLAAELVLQSRERALVGMLTEDGDPYEDTRLVAELKANGRLTPSLILRVLCTGNIDFFEEALARLAGLPIVTARRLIHDPGPLGLPALYQRCGLPGEIFPVVRAAVEIVDETQYDGRAAGRARFIERIIDRVTSLGDDPRMGEEIDWLIDRLAQANGGHGAKRAKRRA